MAKFFFLGFLVFVSLILNITALFTPNWTNYQLGLRLSGPPTWMIVPSYLMIVTSVMSLITIAVYFFVFFKIKSDDYSEELRKWFRIIILAGLISVITTIIAIILISENMATWSTLGFSAWLALIAVISTVGVMATAESIASEEC